MNALSTPYENQRRRLAWLERTEAFRDDVPIARARRDLARKLQLSPDQIRNILRGRVKHLYADIASRIDGAFVALAERALKDLTHDLAIAARTSQTIDPGVVDRAQAAKGALETLIKEASERAS